MNHGPLKIAHIILCHKDLEHIERLARKLCTFSDCYIHVDTMTASSSIEESLKDISNCHFISERYHCNWGGWNAVQAEIALLRSALYHKEYDRFVFLQGADYPIKSPQEIVRFFERNRNVEFIRGCCCSTSSDVYFYSRCKGLHFYNSNILIRKFMRLFRLDRRKIRSGYITVGKEKYPVYWGSAQWALTNYCVRYIIDFYDKTPKFNRWFYYAFPPDELYFTTVVMNSPFREMTTNKGPEPEQKYLVSWRNLHYFIYDNYIHIFKEEDFDIIQGRPELYCRKVTTEDSSDLLDQIDREII